MKIGIVGYGKMGKAIETLALQRGHEIAWIMHSRNADQITEEQILGADLAIEFSRPESAWGNLRRLLGLGIPVVCGTTGWDEDLPKAQSLALESGTGFLHAANFSLGVQLFFSLNRYLARIMAPHSLYDVKVQEIHHTQKKDAPSGTAIRIAEGILEERKEAEGWQLMESGEANPKPGFIPISSVREDPVPGTHEVCYASEIDEIRILHQANSRGGFALGALVAAEFLLGKEGVFTMRDVLGLVDEA